jgi:hypothetical protein
MGMSTGRANRACLLNSALLQNGSVVQVHGIPPHWKAEGRMQTEEGRSVLSWPIRIHHSSFFLLHCFPACSSKGTVRFINGVALDECLARERYPARRPFRPQSISSDALLWYGSQPGATPGEGSNFGGRPQGLQSSQRSSEFHKLTLSGAAPGTATTTNWIHGVMDYWMLNRRCISPIAGSHLSNTPPIQ